MIIKLSLSLVSIIWLLFASNNQPIHSFTISEAQNYCRAISQSPSLIKVKEIEYQVDSTLEASPTALPGRARITRTPRPTATPVSIPPPTSPTNLNIMIFLALGIVVIILLGIWLNRHNIHSPKGNKK